MRRRDIQLVSLVCRSCGTELPAIDGDVVFTCPGCHLAQELDGGALRPVEVEFAAPLRPAEGFLFHLPFYRFEFDPIQFTKARLRRAASTDDKIWEQMLDGKRPARQEEFRLAYVPGFNSAAANVAGDVTWLLTAQGADYERVRPGLLLGCSRSSRDARALLEIYLLQAAPKRQCQVTTVELRLAVRRQVLLGVPFFHMGQNIVDGFLGMRWPLNYREDLEAIVSATRRAREGRRR